jgi:hypothetical protein
MDGRLPEDLGGVERSESTPHPGFYAKASQPQGWSASSIILLIQALLGMHAAAPLRLLLVDPHLPPWLDELTLRGISVGDATVDLRFWRSSDGTSHFRVIGRQGRLAVIRQPVPQGPEASLRHRLIAGATSIVRNWL